MQELEDAVYSSTGYNSLGKHYTEYIDIKSAAIMYLLHEFSVNIDGGKSSCYFYKDSNLTGDGKVHAAPCWDFDVTRNQVITVKHMTHGLGVVEPINLKRLLQGIMRLKGHIFTGVGGMM